MLTTSSPTENDIDWAKFQADWNARARLCLKWVAAALAKRRISSAVSEELKEYYTSRKCHRQLAADALSDQMKCAVKSCDLEVGTDIEWARRASKGWGKWGPEVLRQIEEMGEDEALKGYEPLWDVGESDLESDVGADGRWVKDGEDEGKWRDVFSHDDIEEIDGERWMMTNAGWIGT